MIMEGLTNGHVYAYSRAAMEEGVRALIPTRPITVADHVAVSIFTAWRRIEACKFVRAINPIKLSAGIHDLHIL